MCSRARSSLVSLQMLLRVCGSSPTVGSSRNADCTHSLARVVSGGMKRQLESTRGLMHSRRGCNRRRRHRRRDGRLQHRRRPRGRDDGAHRRQLRLDRRRRRGRSRGLRQHPQVHHLHVRARDPGARSVPDLRALRQRDSVGAHCPGRSWRSTCAPTQPPLWRSTASLPSLEPWNGLHVRARPRSSAARCWPGHGCDSAPWRHCSSSAASSS